MNSSASSSVGIGVSASHWRRFRALYLLLAVCIAPVLASYTAYYLLPPSGRTNYGELLSPQRVVPELQLQTIPEGARRSISAWRGRWILLSTDRGACDDDCGTRLWVMRQVRLTQGRDSDRIERVWLITDETAPAESLRREYEGTQMLRARRDELAPLLVLPAGGASGLEDHLWLIDPLGNLMLRWPANVDPNRMKKDLSRLLKASRIG
jgi:hypothetical protein